VITLLLTGVLYLTGLARDFIRSVAFGKNEAGGPLESMTRLVKGQLSAPRADEDLSTSGRTVWFLDELFRWVVRRILNVIPDVDRYDLTVYVAEGFNIGGGQLLLTLGALLLYLLPWAVLGYYLIRWREVASPN
jgi:hypothetical protein